MTAEFWTEDQAYAFFRWGDDASVDLVAPRPGRITYRSLNWRRGFDRAVSLDRREWRNIVQGGDLARLFALPLPRPKPKEIGSPTDLYAACAAGRLVAWGRYRGGRMEPVPAAEWADGRPKDWADFMFRPAELIRARPAPSDAAPSGQRTIRAEKTDGGAKVAKFPEVDWLRLPEAYERACAYFDHMDPDAVGRALVQEFSEGRIETDGICREWYGHAERQIINGRVWDPDLVSVTRWDLDCFERTRNGDKYLFFFVRVNRRGLEGWFQRGAPARPPTGSIKAQTDCQRWLFGLMKAGKQEKPRDEYKAEAVQKFGISARSFLVAWGNAKTDTGTTDWGKPGPKKSRHRIDTPTQS